MQRRIQPLSQQLANQIAAGEVVERPASVVKELLENSIDAGATRVELDLQQGGSKCIRVLDDGAGIHRDDLALAASPHATSKIYSQQELEQIASLGFRGEALASIASVCRFTLSSRQQGEEGWLISNNSKGGLTAPVPSSLPEGTSVEVRDLFYNTPARRKFLRSERTEFLHVEEVLRRLALSRFDIAFSLSHNGRQTLRLRPAKDDAQKTRRVADVLGNGFVQQAMTLEFEAAGMRMWGWLAGPDYSRSQADSQYFYLNGRIIRDKLINHAVRQAFQSVLEPGRYPACLLFLEVDPRLVDINVHPTKHEVRFRESRLVHDFVFRSLLNTLEGSTAIPQEQVATPLQTVTRSGSAQGGGTAPTKYRAERPRVAESLTFYRHATQPTPGKTRQTPPAAGPLGKGLALLYGRYLLAQNTEGPLVLDLDAAREFLLTQRLEAMLADGEVQSQPLLIPATLELDEELIAVIEPSFGEMLRLGFVIERLGVESVVLREVPVIARDADVTLILHRLFDRVQQTAGEVQAQSAEMISTLVRGIVGSSKVERLGDAEQIMRELESQPELPQRFWRSLPQATLEQWLGTSL